MNWAYGPITQYKDANRSEDGQLRLVTETALKEEMKVIYDSPKSIRSEKSPRKHLSKVV